jgi:hypothetical protein
MFLTIGMSVRILRFWTLSIDLFISKTPSCLYFKTRRFGYWILSPSSGKTYSYSEVRTSSLDWTQLRKWTQNPEFWNINMTTDNVQEIVRQILLETRHVVRATEYVPSTLSPRSASPGGAKKQTLVHTLTFVLLEDVTISDRYRVMRRGRLMVKVTCQTLGVTASYVSANEHAHTTPTLSCA